MEEVLLPAVEALRDEIGAAPAPEYGFAWRWATGWLAAAQRAAPPAARLEAVVVFDASAACDVDALHAQALVVCAGAASAPSRSRWGSTPRAWLAPSPRAAARSCSPGAARRSTRSAGSSSPRAASAAPRSRSSTSAPRCPRPARAPSSGSATARSPRSICSSPPRGPRHRRARARRRPGVARRHGRRGRRAPARRRGLAASATRRAASPPRARSARRSQAARPEPSAPPAIMRPHGARAGRSAGPRGTRALEWLLHAETSVRGPARRRARPGGALRLGLHRPRRALHGGRRARAPRPAQPPRTSKADASEVVTTLEQRGLVCAARLPHDRRSAVVRLTAAGQAEVDRLFPDHTRRVQGGLRGPRRGREALTGAALPQAGRVGPAYDRAPMLRRRAPGHAAPGRPPAALPALEERVLQRWRDRDVFRESCAGRARAPWVFYEGPPTANGRPAPTTCSRGSSRTSTRASARCRATSSSARAAGTRTGCRWRSRWSASSASARSRRSRRTGSRSSTRSAESVFTVPRGVERAHRADRVLAGPRRRLRTLDPELHRVGVVGAAPDQRQGPALRGASVIPVLPRLRDRAVEPRGRARLPRRRRPVVYVRFPVAEDGGPLRPATAAHLDHDAVDARLQRRRRRRPRAYVRAREDLAPGARPRAGRGARRTPARRRTRGSTCSIASRARRSTGSATAPQGVPVPARRGGVRQAPPHRSCWPTS